MEDFLNLESEWVESGPHSSEEVLATFHWTTSHMISCTGQIFIDEGQDTGRLLTPLGTDSSPWR